VKLPTVRYLNHRGRTFATLLGHLPPGPLQPCSPKRYHRGDLRTWVTVGGDLEHSHIQSCLFSRDSSSSCCRWRRSLFTSSASWSDWTENNVSELMCFVSVGTLNLNSINQPTNQSINQSLFMKRWRQRQTLRVGRLSDSVQSNPVIGSRSFSIAAARVPRYSTQLSTWRSASLQSFRRNLKTPLVVQTKSLFPDLTTSRFSTTETVGLVDHGTWWHLFIYSPSVHPSIHPSIHPCIYLFIYLLFIYLSLIYLLVCFQHRSHTAMMDEFWQLSTLVLR